MNELYHGTLAQNLQSIRETGLRPQKGSWTSDFHSDAIALVYAVGENHRGRLSAVLTGQMAKAGLVQWSDNYQFGHFKSDLVEHCAVIVVSTARFSCYPDRFQAGHPPGSEPGDWYSREAIGIGDIKRILVGQEMLDWLKPSELDFMHRLREVLRERCVR
jgi:hypothetical protein